MTDLRGDDAADSRGSRPRWSLATALNLVGVVVVGFWLVVDGPRGHGTVAVSVLGGVALAAWVVRELGPRRAQIVASAVMVVTGAAAVVGTHALLVVPVIIGLVLLQAAPELPVWGGTVAALVAAVEIGAAALVSGAAVGSLAGPLAGLVLGILIGISRRQARIAAADRRRAEDEERRVALLADRARAARDVHDVLAHALGGLVLQLDAVEALLEAGRADEAARRAGSARALAADGLAEARRAVATLRGEPGEPDGQPAPDERPTPPASTPRTVPATGAAHALDPLLDTHRDLGGTVELSGSDTLVDLDDAHVRVLVAVCREALVNARRHAPGRPVTIRVRRTGARASRPTAADTRTATDAATVTGTAPAVEVTVTNPRPAPGHGLVGMGERVAELGDGSVVSTDATDEAFTVRMLLAASDHRAPTHDRDADVPDRTAPA